MLMMTTDSRKAETYSNVNEKVIATDMVQIYRDRIVNHPDDSVESGVDQIDIHRWVAGIVIYLVDDESEQKL